MVTISTASNPRETVCLQAVDYKESLGDFASAHAVVKEVKDLLAPYPGEAFPLLRRKIKMLHLPSCTPCDRFPGTA